MMDDDELDGPLGTSYAGVLVRLPATDEATHAREATLAVLVQARFSGWLGPVEDGWVVAVADNPEGSVAGDRTGVPTLTGVVAAALGTVALGVVVTQDRRLRLTLASEGTVLGTYDSDPSQDATDEDAWAEPSGEDLAEALLITCRSPGGGSATSAQATDTGPVADAPDLAFAGPWSADEAPDLEGLLAEQLDHDSVLESERLTAVLRHLGLPDWFAAAGSLPRSVPGGPDGRAFTRLGAGTTGPLGLARGAVVGAVRRRRPPRPS